MTRWDRVALGLLLVGLWVVGENLKQLREDLWTRRSMDEHVITGSLLAAMEALTVSKANASTLTVWMELAQELVKPTPERQKWTVPRWGAAEEAALAGAAR